jgi:hypothetical protein
MTARIYETGVDERDPEAILSRALKLKKSGSLRVFHGDLSIGAKNALKPHLVGYLDATIKIKSGGATGSGRTHSQPEPKLASFMPILVQHTKGESLPSVRPQK